MKKLLRSLSETEAFASQILEMLPLEKNPSGASVLALSGNLGSGKTAFTKLLAKRLLIKERVLSPTFILEREYDIKNHPQFTRFIHIDAYRLENEKDLAPLKLEKKLSDPKTLCVVEWAERVRKGLPKNALWITFSFINEETRRAEIKK